MGFPYMHEHRAVNREQVVIPFRFRPNGTGDPDMNLVVGNGVNSIVWTGTGRIGVALDGEYPEIEAITVQPWFELTPPYVPNHAMSASLPVAANGETTFEIAYAEYDTGTDTFVDTDVASNPNVWFCVVVYARTTTVNG